MKKTLVGMLVICISFLSFSCGAQKNIDDTAKTVESLETQLENSTEATTSSSEKTESETTESAVKFVYKNPEPGYFNVGADIVDAKEYFDYELCELDFGEDYDSTTDDIKIGGLFSEDELIVLLSHTKYYTDSIGLYNLKDKTYKELYKFDYEDIAVFVADYNTKYIILNSTQDKGLTSHRKALRLEDNTLLAIPDRIENFRDYLMINDLVLKDDVLYFNDIEPHENGKSRAHLYSYNLKEGGDIQLVREDSINPQILNGELVFMAKDDETSQYALLKNLKEEVVYILPKNFRTYIASKDGDNVVVTSTENDELHKLTNTTIHDLKNGIEIYTVQQTTGNVALSDSLTGWHAFFKVHPMLYLHKLGKIVEFKDLPELENDVSLFKNHAFITFTAYDSEAYRSYYYITPKSILTDKNAEMSDVVK